MLDPCGKKSVSENGNCEPAEIKSKNTVIATGEDTEITICRPGSYTEVGSLDIPLDFVEKNTALTLKVRIGDSISAYPIWVYRKTTPVCPENVYETRAFDVKTREILQMVEESICLRMQTKRVCPIPLKHSLRRISGRWELLQIRKAVWGS